MQNQAEFLLVQTSCPDNDSAIVLAQRIIKEKVAACVNVLPPVTSIYEWKGEIKQDSEVLLLIKIQKCRYPDLQALICATHPYELPEVIAVPISEGLPEFLSWIRDETSVASTVTKV
ncbi:MAG: divalent-cation tolerance protein CutA [Gammaproteobacteria bacterium]|nr:divalent-cation tolerance protein CutA [Gammaproteobacteria bacterium]